ncbi:MAG TPA: helix-turn-helix domain-containing protein, partial [Terracidiphilus sp.]
GQFRADLYYRLNVIPLSLPPLRERREDLSVLAHHFASRAASSLGIPTPRLMPDFLTRLESHSWPGNIRELSNFIRRVITLSDRSDIDAGCFDAEFHGNSVARPQLVQPAASVMKAGAPMRELEREHLENTLALTDGNRTRAAEMLGISLRTLRNRIREYGLPPRRYA